MNKYILPWATDMITNRHVMWPYERFTQSVFYTNGTIGGNGDAAPRPGTISIYPTDMYPYVRMYE